MAAPSTTPAALWPGPDRGPQPRESALLEGLRRRAVPIALVVVACATLAASFSLLRSDRYEASAELLFGGAGPEIQLLGGQVNFGGNDERQVANSAALLRSRRVAGATARRLPPMTEEQVADAITVQPQQQADVITVTAAAKSRADAAAIANAYAGTFRELQARQEAERAAQARDVLSDRLASLRRAARSGLEGQSLRARIAQLRALERVGTGSPQIIDSASAAEATRTGGRLPVTIALGALLGLVLGIVLAAIREQLDARLRRPDDIEEAFGIPVLAGVPRSRAIGRAVPFGALDEADAEAFRILAAKLCFGDGGGSIRSLLVTSARNGEGKSTVAWYLACALAASRLNVLLVDADLRRPTLAHRHGLDVSVGLADVLAEGSDPDRALVRVPIGTDDAAPTMDVLPGMPPAGGVVGLVQPSWVGDLIATLSERYDLVVVDTPPVTQVADAIPLAHRVDAVLVAARFGVTARRDAATVRAQLEDVGARLRGVVAGFAPPERVAYGDASAKKSGRVARSSRRIAAAGVVAAAATATVVAVATYARGRDDPAGPAASGLADPALSAPACSEATKSAGDAYEGTCRTKSAVLTLVRAPGPLVLPDLSIAYERTELTSPETPSGQERRRIRVTIAVRITNTSDRTLTLGRQDPEFYLYLPASRRRVAVDAGAGSVPGSLHAAGVLAPNTARSGTLRFELSGDLTRVLQRTRRADLGVRPRSDDPGGLVRAGVIHVRVS